LPSFKDLSSLNGTILHLKQVAYFTPECQEKYSILEYLFHLTGLVWLKIVAYFAPE